MKYKTTKKEMKNRFNQIIKVGYENLQFLLKFVDPFAYSTRSEGWACDYYNINGVLISTGYAPMESKNTKKHGYDFIREYDDKAREIACNYNLSYEQQKDQVMKLLDEFIKECI
jgi:hypothetical protein